MGGDDEHGKSEGFGGFIYGTYWVEIIFFIKNRVNYVKKLFKFTKKIIHVNNMMIYNFIKYYV